MKPKEGTILTVAKGGAAKAKELAEEGVTDLGAFFDGVIKHAEYVLDQTPEMLPVLKQAGVVDSGGQGLVQVLKGAYDAFLGKEIDLTIEDTKEALTKQAASNREATVQAEIKFGYCTEFIILLSRNFNIRTEMDFKAYLESIGDSIVVVADDDVVKVHVHTNDPGLAIQEALTHGSLSRIKIDNMREEHQERLIKDAQKLAAQQAEEAAAQQEAERKDIGFIAVSVGDGLSEVFRGLGADYMIEGGQTMNPSTEDILNAIAKVPADHVFVLPNNKNIILAANQAAALSEDKQVHVIPTKTIPQGITALINFIPEQTAEENEARMLDEIKNVKTGQVTYAVRDTVIDDKEIRQDDYMGIGDKTILAVGRELEQVTLEMTESMIDDDSAIVSIYYGEEVTEDAANAIAQKITAGHEDLEVEVQYGGQPIYYYLISVE